MKKFLLGAATVATITAAAISLAGAQTAPSTNPAPMSVAIERNGNAKIEGTIVSISGTTVNVASWGGTWIVDASSAKIVRRLGGKSSLSEFQAGDQVMVMGNASPSGAWAITARSIKDASIQERGASFAGTISNLNSTNQTFTLTTKNRGNVSVTANADTKITVNRKSASFGDLNNGMYAAISGLWDRTQSTVTASKITVRTNLRPAMPRNTSSTTSH